MKIKSNTIKALVILTLLGIVSIVILHSFTQQYNHKRNAFIRLVPPHMITPLPTTFDLKFNSYYFAGISDSSIYLGNLTAPLHLMVINLTLNKSVGYNLTGIEKDTLKTPMLFINSSTIYLTDGLKSKIYTGSLLNKTLDSTLRQIPQFDLAIPLSSRRLAIRTFDGKNNRNVLSLLNITENKTSSYPNLLKRQQDGIFSTDGMFSFDENTKTLIYLYYYRNEYLVLDTNFNLVTQGKTIDTNSVAKIKVAEIQSQNVTTLSGPAMTVNKNLFTYDGNLFVCSALLSQNESKDAFNISSVIDVYSINKNRYLYSFYIPDFGGKKMKYFYIHKNIIYVIYDHYLVSYILNSGNFKAMN